MGEIIRLHCQKCGFEQDFFVGGGMRDCELKIIYDALSAEGQRLLSAAVSYGATQLSITRRLHVCESCGAVYTLPVVSYNLHGLIQEIYGACPHCGAEGSVKSKENIIPSCPECEGEMTRQQVGHWD